MVNFMNFLPQMASPASGSAGYLLPDICDAGRILLGEKNNSFSGYDSFIGGSMIYSPSMTSYLGAVPKFGAAGLFGSFPTFGPTSGNIFGLDLQPPPFLNLPSFSSKEYFAPVDMNNLPTIELDNSGSYSSGSGASSGANNGSPAAPAGGIPSSTSAPSGGAAPAGGASFPAGSATAAKTTTATARSLPSDVKAFVEKYNGDGSVANRPQITARFLKDGQGNEILCLQFDLNKDVECNNAEGSEMIKAIKELSAKYSGNLMVRFGDFTEYDKAYIAGDGFINTELENATYNHSLVESAQPRAITSKYDERTNFSVNKNDKHYYVKASRLEGETALRGMTGDDEEGFLFVEYTVQKQNSSDLYSQRWYEVGNDGTDTSVELSDEPVVELKNAGIRVDVCTFYHQHPKKFDDRYEPPSFADLDSYLKFAEKHPDVICELRVVTARGVYVINLPFTRDENEKKAAIKKIRQAIGDGNVFDAETVRQRDAKLLTDPLCRRYADLGFRCSFEEFAEDVPANTTPAQPAAQAPAQPVSPPQPAAGASGAAADDGVPFQVEEVVDEPALPEVPDFRVGSASDPTPVAADDPAPTDKPQTKRPALDIDL